MRGTSGHLLGGRVLYEQPAEGYRTGIEPVLLAAAVPARSGERVLEAGTGAGAALLCLAWRVPGLTGLGVERDPGLAALAERNAGANGWSDRLRVVNADLAALPESGMFDHALANPPWHAPGGTASPVPGRRAAKQAGPGLLGLWAGILGAHLRRHGSLTMILPAQSLAEGIAALSAARCGGVTVLPLWPHAGDRARLLLLSGRRESHAPGRLPPGLVLHRSDGGYTPEAEAILRNGQSLPL